MPRRSPIRLCRKPSKLLGGTASGLFRTCQYLGAIGASISGAGPTVLFWCHWEQTGNLYEAVRDAAADCEVRRVQFTPGGADVRAL